MLKHSLRNGDSRLRIHLSLLLVAFIASPISGWSLSFTLPTDVALRIRLDDTLTSTDSRVGDPFSATVVDQGKYRNARVYGHISSKVSGVVHPPLNGHASSVHDGRQAHEHVQHGGAALVLGRGTTRVPRV